MITSKYLNDKGEAESVLNFEWTKIGVNDYRSKHIVVKHLGRINSYYAIGSRKVGLWGCSPT